MGSDILHHVSFDKYSRLLTRAFPAAVGFEIRDGKDTLHWQYPAADDNQNDGPAWSDFGGSIERRQVPAGPLQFRAPLLSRQLGNVGWLIVNYDVETSVPMSTAPEPMRRAFNDATVFLQEEVDLQAECNQLAIELTERYEELNLVYSTKDHVEYFEEGQEALVRLVLNCADYLDVELAALICRDRNLSLHNSNASLSDDDVKAINEILATTVYDHIEAQVQSVVLNETDSENRARLFGNRAENLLAYPIVDDHGTAIGLLAVVARQEKHTFSNGDRNLLEVMTKKASRIIHTHHDSLTGLMNRSGFESSLVSILNASRNSNQHHCLLHVDLDQLHVVNDLLGYEVGDGLIRRAARSIRAVLRDTDIVARLGGDEFGVLLTNCGEQKGHFIADKIRNAIHELTVVSATRQLNVSTSIGLALMTQESEGIVGMMAAAEIACKAAKEAGRDRIQVFARDDTMLVRRSEEVEWIGRIQQALRDDQFTLHCQPVAPLDEAESMHFEILVRMLDEKGTVLAPGLFLPAAERYQLMPLLDRWVIRTSLRVIGEKWQDLAHHDAVFCINLSGQSLTNPGFDAFVLDEISRSPIPAANLCFEITETAAISNIDEALSFIRGLREKGCRFSLDDFGAGLSSFGYLKVLPVDYLKIDGSFIREITSDDISLSMVSAICQIGSTMGLSLVAEYVGDEETKELLNRIGVDYVQGFGIGKPVPLQETIRELTEQTKSIRA
ncbi:MAG: EAL domain-containing protein [Gammaproteobacteria bacterium]|nr:EAL domain-containing protein [Gammaproteobacteria bacterium]